MSERVAISKKTRFEVFKRDSFTCQYCGSKAPDVVLHVDHIKPVAAGGTNDIMNLVTACSSCNGGKGARELSDASAVEKQRRQMEELQERRDQLEMMLEWRAGLDDIKADMVAAVEAQFRSLTKRGFTETGKQTVRRWLRTFSLAEILDGLQAAADFYLRYDKDGHVTEDSAYLAFSKIRGCASVNKAKADKPYLTRLFYIQGILRNRTGDRNLRCVDGLESWIEDGATVETMEYLAKRADSWAEFEGMMIVTMYPEKPAK